MKSLNSPLSSDDEIRACLRQSLAWLEDSGTPLELSGFARDVARLALEHLADEQALTDVLNVVRRAAERGDLLALSLAEDLPFQLRDGRQPRSDALTRLGNHVLAAGVIESLVEVAHAAVEARVSVPPAWIKAILESESGGNPREVVVELLDRWLERTDSDSAQLGDLLDRRQAILDQPYSAQAPL